MTASPPAAPPVREWVDSLAAAGSEFGRTLAGAWSTPLRDYLRELVPAEDPSPPGPWLAHLLDALAVYLDRHAEPHAEEVCSALERRRVIQQADHSNLLLDEETLLNNYLFHVAAREAGLPIALHSQCSTVACFSRRVPPTGPVFLHSRGGVYDVFGRSKTEYKRSSFCALRPPLTLEMRPLDGEPWPASGTVLQPWLGRRFSDAADAYRSVNAQLWSVLDTPRGARRVQVDERMTSEALARHLLDESSPVHRLVVEPPLRATFLEVKRRLVDSPANLAVNRALPDFFWWRGGSRLRPLAVDGDGRRARFVVAGEGRDPGVGLDAARLAAALRSGAVYGDRVLSYAVRCLLPGVVAVGGSVQQDYVALYRRLFLEVHRLRPFLDAADVQRLEHGSWSRLGGRPLLELPARWQAAVAELGPGTPLPALEDELLDEPVGRTVGTLGCVWFYDDLVQRARSRAAPS